MNKLCTRARAVLNLLLLIISLQLWVVFTVEESTIIDDVRALAADLAPFHYRASAQAFIDSYREARSRSPQWDVQSIPLSKLAAITSEDLNPQIDTEALFGPAARIAGNSPSYAQLKEAFTHLAAGTSADGLPRLKRLHDQIAAADLPLDKSTVYDLERAFVRQIEIPFVKQRIQAHTAIFILGAAAAALLAYLLTVLDYMRRIVSISPPPRDAPEVFDCILLYPSPLAGVLAVVWILAPCALLAIGLFETFHIKSWASGSLLITGLLILTTAFAVPLVRQTQALRKLTTLPKR